MVTQLRLQTLNRFSLRDLQITNNIYKLEVNLTGMILPSSLGGNNQKYSVLINLDRPGILWYSLINLGCFLITIKHFICRVESNDNEQVSRIEDWAAVEHTIGYSSLFLSPRNAIPVSSDQN